jgi:glucosylceramidase
MNWSKRKIIILGAPLAIFAFSCSQNPQVNQPTVEILETSRSGNQLTQISPINQEADIHITLFPDTTYQTILGIGGAFTESAAYLLKQLPASVADSIMASYFGDEGARYSLCRTHMASCDFSLNSYTYAAIAGDTTLEHFNISRDHEYLIPMIRAAQKKSVEGFKLMASAWTAPPWMKTNQHYFAGKLKPEYYQVWANYFVKYAEAYAAEEIPIWGFTNLNEPLGNDSSWESMHFTAHEMANFIENHLGPVLEKANPDLQLLIFDQNRDEALGEWTSLMLTNPKISRYINGTAVHWYHSTVDWFPEALQAVHQLDPEKYIIQTEGCIDAEVPRWQDDDWYWRQEATDWGWDWAPDSLKYLHPKYIPVHRYAQDLIGCLNNQVTGWVDWNMILDDKGGPNHANNWCIAPIIVKPETHEVYYTPLYFVMKHFSNYIRPEAKRIHHICSDGSLLVTAVINPDGSVVAMVFNPGQLPKTFNLELNKQRVTVPISGQALQTIRFSKL